MKTFLISWQHPNSCTHGTDYIKAEDADHAIIKFFQCVEGLQIVSVEARV